MARSGQGAGQSLSDSFQAKVKLERFGYPRSLQFFSLSRESTVNAPCQNNSIFAFSITVVLSSFIVDVSVIQEIDLKTVNLAKQMPGNCVYEEYG